MSTALTALNKEVAKILRLPELPEQADLHWELPNLLEWANVQWTLELDRTLQGHHSQPVNASGLSS